METLKISIILTGAVIEVFRFFPPMFDRKVKVSKYSRIHQNPLNHGNSYGIFIKPFSRQNCPFKPNYHFPVPLSLLQNFHPNFDVVGIKVLPPFFISIHTYFPHVSALDRLLNFMFNLDTSFQSLYGEESERKNFGIEFLDLCICMLYSPENLLLQRIHVRFVRQI